MGSSSKLTGCWQYPVPHGCGYRAEVPIFFAGHWLGSPSAPGDYPPDLKMVVCFFKPMGGESMHYCFLSFSRAHLISSVSLNDGAWRQRAGDLKYICSISFAT